MAVWGRIERQNYKLTFGTGLGGVAEKTPQPQASSVMCKLMKNLTDERKFATRNEVGIFNLIWKEW